MSSLGEIATLPGGPTTLAGTSTTTGDGGMTEEERGHSNILVYQLLPSRYGMNPDDLRKADAIEVVLGQGRWRSHAGHVGDDADRRLSQFSPDRFAAGTGLADGFGAARIVG